MVETGFGIIVVAHEKHMARVDMWRNLWPEAATAKTSALLAAEHEMASEMKELKAKAEHWMGMDHGEKKAFEALENGERVQEDTCCWTRRSQEAQCMVVQKLWHEVLPLQDLV